MSAVERVMEPEWCCSTCQPGVRGTSGDVVHESIPTPVSGDGGDTLWWSLQRWDSVGPTGEHQEIGDTVLWVGVRSDVGVMELDLPTARDALRSMIADVERALEDRQ